MDKKQKARKHLLRRLITNAALAGTAFSTFGGALASTMEVKADEQDLIQFIIKKAAERKVNDFDESKDKKILDDIKQHLKTLPYSDIQKYLLDLDNSRWDIKKLYSLDAALKPFRTYFSTDRDVYRNGWTLTSLLIQEAQRRVEENEERKQVIVKKEFELEKYKEEEKELIKEKNKLESALEVKAYEAAQKGQELDETKEKLTSESRRANLNGLAMIDLKKERDAANDKIKELTEKLDKVSKEYDEFAKLAEAAQADYEKELALDDEKLNQEASKNKELSDSLKTAEESYKASQAKLAEVEEAKSNLMSELENAQKALEEAEKSMTDFSGKVETLTSELEASKAEVAKLEAKAAEVNKELEATKSAKESLEKEIEEMKAKQAEEVAKLEALIKEKDADITRIQEELASKEKAFEDKEKMSEQEKANFQAEIERLQKELADKLAAKAPAAEKEAVQKAVDKAAAKASDAHTTKAETTENKAQLPSTGEKAANPILVAAGLTFLVGAGTYAYAGRGKKD